MRKSGLRERLVQISPAPGRPFDHAEFEIIVEEISKLDQIPALP
jgi:hypothetical protein